MPGVAGPETAVARSEPGPIERVPLFGTGIDRVTMPQAVRQVMDWIAEPDGPCRYVVTPNVDHVVMMRSRADLRSAYRDASLVTADGWPLVAASRRLSRPLPERVAGSDLAPAVFAAAAERGGLRVFLLGGMPGVPERAAAEITKRWPYVEVVGVESPPFGFELDDRANDRVVEAINAARPDLLLVGLGAPKQELWLHRQYGRLKAGVAMGVGATIDFLAGEQRRAPRWVQRIGMEWLYRAASDPRRLAGRYARDLVVFPCMFVEEWRRVKRG